MWLNVAFGASCGALAGTLGWRCIRVSVQSPGSWIAYGLCVVALTCAVASLVEGPQSAAVLWFTAAGLVLAGVDVVLLRLPNVLVYPTVIVLAVWLVAAAFWMSQPGVGLRVLLSATVAGLVYLLLHVVSPNGLGMGDVKFAPAVAMVMGWYSWGWVVVSALAAFVFAAAWGIGLQLSRRASRELPFGPFMVAGAAATPVVADPLLQWWW